MRQLPQTPLALWPAFVPRGMILPAEAKLLYGLAREVSEGAIVEVGAFRGRSTVALALGSRAGNGAPVYAIEPHEPSLGENGARFGPKDRAAFFRTMLGTRCYRDVRLINLSSEEVCKGWTRAVGCLWIDGDHSEAGVRRDLDAWWPHLLNGAVVAFDDAREPTSGPGVVIAEEVNAGRIVLEQVVGKVSVFRAIKR